MIRFFLTDPWSFNRAGLINSHPVDVCLGTWLVAPDVPMTPGPDRHVDIRAVAAGAADPSGQLALSGGSCAFHFGFPGNRQAAPDIPESTV